MHILFKKFCFISKQYFSIPHNMWSNGDNIKNLLSLSIVIVTKGIPGCVKGRFALERVKAIKFDFVTPADFIWACQINFYWSGLPRKFCKLRFKCICLYLVQYSWRIHLPKSKSIIGYKTVEFHSCACSFNLIVTPNTQAGKFLTISNQ